METNPLLARRVIPGKERAQKALVVLLLTAALVGGGWYATDASPDSDVRLLAALAGAALLGLCLALYFGLHKYETARSKEDSQAIRERIADDRSGAGWLGRFGYALRRFVFGIVILAGLLVALAGLGILGWQVVDYLQSGEWHSRSALAALYQYVPWLRDPQSWHGLYKLVRQFLALLPLSLVLILAGWLIAGLGSALRGRVKRKGP